MSLPFETNKTSTSGEPAKEGTVRIEVELEKTGDDSFPEFSYVALVDELKKQNPNSKPPNGADKGKMIRDVDNKVGCVFPMGIWFEFCMTHAA